MITRHEANIRNMIDELEILGHARVSKDLLVKAWYGQARDSKTIWKDIASKFPEDMKPKHYAVFEWNDDIVIVEKACCKSFEEKMT